MVSRRRKQTQVVAESRAEYASVTQEMSTPGFVVATLDDASEMRERQAYELRLRGTPWKVIADACGYTDQSTAFRAAHRYASHIHSDTSVEQERDMVSGMYNQLLELLIPVARGDVEDESGSKESKLGKPNLWAVDRVTVLLENYSKLRGLHRVDPSAVAAQVLIRSVTADLDAV